MSIQKKLCGLRYLEVFFHICHLTQYSVRSPYIYHSFRFSFLPIPIWSHGQDIPIQNRRVANAFILFRPIENE